MSYYRGFVPKPDAEGVRHYWRGAPEKPQQCRYAIERAGEVHQCRRRRGFGTEHAFCSQHARVLRGAEGGA